MMKNKDKGSYERVMEYVKSDLLLYVTEKDKFMIQCVMNQPCEQTGYYFTKQLQEALREADFKRTEFNKPYYHFGR